MLLIRERKGMQLKSIPFRLGERYPLTFAITHDPINYFDKLLHNILTVQWYREYSVSKSYEPTDKLIMHVILPIVCGAAVTDNPTRGYRVLYV